MKMGERRFLTGLLLFLAVLGCASRVLEYDKADQILRTDEYDKKLQVKEVSPAPAPPPLPEAKAEPLPKTKTGKKKKKAQKVKVSEETVAKVDPNLHLPDLEDSVGFVGRRPLKDPFRVGEKTTLNLTYFGISAGTMDVAVKPMVEVNGRKAYNFEVTAKSGSFFNHIYGVDDKAVTYVGYDDLRPLNLQITIKESKQLAETRTLFDWQTLRASYWKKRVTKEHGEESKQIDWNVQDYSQNVISAAYYLRTFNYEVGKKLAFRVADEGKNIVFTGEVLRKEVLDTDVGPINTVVLKPQLTVDGVFTPVGEILFWLSDDDRKFIVRIESKIRIGTIVAKLKGLEKGQE